MLHYVYMSIFSKQSYLRETRNIKIDSLLERHAFQIETYLCTRIQNFFEFTFQFWIYNYQEWHYCEMHKVKPLLFLFSNNWKLQVFQYNQKQTKIYQHQIFIEENRIFLYQNCICKCVYKENQFFIIQNMSPSWWLSYVIFSKTFHAQ